MVREKKIVKGFCLHYMSHRRCSVGNYVNGFKTVPIISEIKKIVGQYNFLKDEITSYSVFYLFLK